MSLKSLLTVWTDKILPLLARISPFGNPLLVQIVLYIMVAFFFFSLLTHCGRAHADEAPIAQYQKTDLQLDIFGGSTVVRGPTGVIAMNLRFPAVIAHYADLSVGFDIIGESTWCPAGGTGSSCFNNNQAIVHAQVVSPLKYGFELGIGVAHIQHEDNYNSGSIDFSLSLQRQLWARKWPNAYWRYQHFSCAGTCSPNEGRDMILVGYRFQ